MKKVLLSIICAAALVFSINAQHTGGGVPFGISTNLSTTHNIDSKVLPALDLTQLAIEDAVDEKNGTWPRIAKATSVSYTLQNSGYWTTLANGDRVWRIKVSGTNAQGLLFSFKNFYLPPGAKLYAYSEDKVDVLGSFTYANNPSNGFISVGLIPQPSVIVEYYEPLLVQGYGQFEIYEVAQAYRILTPQAADSRDFGDSDPCQVNVNCTPEGTNWQDEKKGVARILLKDGSNWGWCTGSLVNNTAQDCAPYFLTAHHCGETSSVADRSQWFFYFNYESTGCSNGSNPVPNAYSPPASFPSWTQGCTQLSHSNDGGGVNGSDYKLLNLTNLTTTDMTNWGLYLNGWDATDPSNGVMNAAGWNTATGIHHPSGDIKKISSTTGNIFTTQWNGAGLPSHWYIQWNSSTNGHGVTEGGSSGSPLFNSAGRMVGTLTGGSSYCTATSSPDMYGKMSYHWDENTASGGPLGGHLGLWLDPVGSGSTTVLDGTYPPCSPTAPNCSATATSTSVVLGQSVNFVDNSTGIPTTWNWDFGDGIGTSTLQNPTYTYLSTGTFTATLIATNAQGSCTTTVVITVTGSTGCDTLNWLPPGTLTLYSYNAPSSGFLTGTNSFNDISKAQRFSGYAPYTHSTGSIFYLGVAEDGGNGAIARFTVWNEVLGAPGAALSTIDIPMSTLDIILGGAPTLIQVFWNNPVNVAGNPFYVGVEMVGFGAGDSIAVVSTSIGDPTVLGQSFEQQSGGAWFPFNDATNSVGVEIDMVISPYMTDLPPTVGMTSNLTSICEGSSIDFNGSTSTNYDSLEWVLVGGTPNVSTNTLETSVYNTAGTYTAYLQAYGACGGYALDSIPNIVVSPAPTLATSITDATCNAADGIIVATGSGGSGSGYQYSIDGGTTFQASGTFSNLIPGTYTIILEDGNGCQATATVTVNANNTPITVTGTATDENCGLMDGTITITAAGATMYSINAGINFQASNSFTGLVAGTYDIMVQDANGCIGTTTIVVNGSAGAPTISNVAFTDENCGNSDGTITVTATGNPTLTYSIDGTTFQASNVFTGVSAGTYTVTVEDGNGCQSTAPVTLQNLGGATITNVTVVPVSCFGANDGSITITATTPSGTMMYSIDGTTYQASNVFTGLAGGTYTAYVDNGACVTTDAPHVISEPAQVVHTATITSAGCTNSGVIDITATGGSGSYQYSIDGGTTYQAGNSFTGLTAGTYQVIVMDANGCLSVITNETVGSLPAIVINATGADESCMSSNGSISINATGGDGTYQYSIDGGSSYQASGTFTGLSAGTYNISVIDFSGCSSTQTITISNVGGVTVTTNGNQTICDGNTASMIASGATNYNWFEGTLLIGSSNSQIVTPTTTTTYTVIGDDGTCFDTTTVTITVNATPTTTVTSDTTICDGESLTLTAAGGTSYFWTHSGQTSASVSVTPTGSTQTYSVVAFNGTCQGTTASVTVTVAPSPTAVAGSNVTTTYLGSGGNVAFNNTGSTGVSYSWDFGDGNSSTSPSPTHSYTGVGTYTVILTATLGNCTDMDTIVITVLNGVGIEESEFSQGISIYPNPSNGLINLNFELSNSQDVTIRIVDAIGKVVYESLESNISNKVINLDLTDQSKGVYFVVVKGTNDTHTERITLMK